MKNNIGIMILLIMSTLVNGCTVIEGVFKAGVWVGIFIVIAILVVITWIVMKIGKK